MAAEVTVHTIGHSTRSLEAFVKLLDAHGVEHVVDIRTIPKSRRHPHFAGDALAEVLPTHGIGYSWEKALGGLRRPRKDSENQAWRNESFRGYADHMQTEEFERAVEGLIALARQTSVAIMCSEAVPWRCHRSLVGDALVVRGVEVLDIMSEAKAVPHRLTAFAHVDGTKVTYPADDEAANVEQRR